MKYRSLEGPIFRKRSNQAALIIICPLVLLLALKLCGWTPEVLNSADSGLGDDIVAWDDRNRGLIFRHSRLRWLNWGLAMRSDEVRFGLPGFHCSLYWSTQTTLCSIQGPPGFYCNVKI